ncbi:MAG: hypothetical protein E6G31_06275 [Actinobacteria bacterium]|nr:MAG: hypothetical protein E6G31_06275 [Actinomycetota bacterium]
MREIDISTERKTQLVEITREVEAALNGVDGAKHIEAGEENAPSHVRASLAGPQVLVPLEGSRLALGTWQGIFFCEFDGPRKRKVYVTPLT